MRFSHNQLLSACFTYRHDFGLLPDKEKEGIVRVMSQILEHMPENEETTKDKPSTVGKFWENLSSSSYLKDYTDLAYLVWKFTKVRPKIANHLRDALDLLYYDLTDQEKRKV